MTISIQNNSAILTALENLNAQSGASAGTGTIPAGLLDPTSDANQGSDSSASIIDVSGGAAAAALNGLTGSLTTAASTADIAVSAGTTVGSLLAQLQQQAQSASDTTLTTAARTTLDASFKADLAKIQAAVAGASVNGVNLLDGSSAGAAQAATLSGVNLSLGGPLIGVSADASLSDPATAASLANELGQALENVGQAVGQIAAQGQAIQSHLTVVAQAASALSPGVSGSISTDLDGESASLMALQVQQQLSGGGGTVANQSPQAILALFQSANSVSA